MLRELIRLSSQEWVLSFHDMTGDASWCTLSRSHRCLCTIIARRATPNC